MNPNASEWLPPSSKRAAVVKAAGIISPALLPMPPVSPIILTNENLSKIHTDCDNCSRAVSMPVANDADNEEIDENDPLWIAVLRIAEGNKENAKKLISDPDSLAQYSEVLQLIGKDNDNVCTSLSEDVTDSTGNDDMKTSDEAAGEGAAGAGVEIIETDSDPREHINVVFIGHVDAGKSTLSGNILYLTGQVDRRTIEKYEREAKARNRESWFLAYIMDTSEEERARGKTVEVGLAHFATTVKRYTILDAPGHKLYIPNMIMGACQADVGILVIAARRGEFETGFEKGGQTREHAMLAKTLGIKFLVVAINKMDDDTVCWSKDRYDECVGKLKPFLKNCGYAVKRDVSFIPMSALHGDNVVTEVPASSCDWWGREHGDKPGTLLSLLDSIIITGRDANTPSLRIPVLARYVEQGLCVIGKVESGTVCTGDTLAFAPTAFRARVDKIKIADAYVRQARAGENVVLKFSSAPLETINRGYVLTSISHPLTPSCQFIGQVYVVDLLPHRPVFCEGYQCVMHVHTIECPVHCAAVISVTARGSEGADSEARIAGLGDMVVARFRVPQSLAIEEYDVRPELGRFTLRDEGKTIGVGKIVKLPRAK